MAAIKDLYDKLSQFIDIHVVGYCDCGSSSLHKIEIHCVKNLTQC